jgi:hypothetical protein
MKPYQWRRLALGSVLAAIVVTGIALLVVDGEAGAGEDLFLEGRDDVGPDPFSTVALVGNTTTTTATTALSASGSTNPGVTSTTTTTTLAGSSATGKVCDAAALLRDLRGAPGKARAWAEPLDLGADDLADLVRDLEPGTLAEDTRVTNHGYRDGEAVPRQSLLQAGTAVLVDESGVPRVRCASGSPLLPPEDLEDPDYEGRCWEGCRDEPHCSGARCVASTTSSPSTSSTSSSSTSTTAPDDEDDVTTTTRRRTTTTRPASTTSRPAATTSTAAATTTSEATSTTATTAPDPTSTSAP